MCSSVWRHLMKATDVSNVTRISLTYYEKTCRACPQGCYEETAPMEFRLYRVRPLKSGRLGCVYTGSSALRHHAFSCVVLRCGAESVISDRQYVASFMFQQYWSLIRSIAHIVWFRFRDCKDVWAAVVHKHYFSYLDSSAYLPGWLYVLLLVSTLSTVDPLRDQLSQKCRAYWTDLYQIFIILRNLVSFSPYLGAYKARLRTAIVDHQSGLLLFMTSRQCARTAIGRAGYTLGFAAFFFLFCYWQCRYKQCS